MKLKLCIAALSLAMGNAYAQESLDPDIWLARAAEQPLDAVVLDAEQHFEKYGKTKATGYKRFLRWWHRANVNKSPNDGYAKNLSNYSVGMYNKRITAKRVQASQTAPEFSTWEALGPFKEIGTEENNLGRLMSISIGGTDNKTLVITSDGGGIWKSLNDGASWQDISDTLPILDLSYATMAPSDANIIFTTEGSNLTKGTSRLFKSTNGGNSFEMINGHSLISPRKILVHPENPDRLWICAAYSLWYSTDGGRTLNRIINNNNRDETFYDITFKPGDRDTMYASSNKKLYKSTDGGVSFTANENLNITNVTRIATLDSDPDLIWVAEKGFTADKIHQSSNGGTSFTTKTEGNYVGYWPTRNMAFAIHPNYPNVYYLGGINFYRWSDNHPRGSRWQLQTRIHADIQEIKFVGNALYVVTDGGISKITDNDSTPFAATFNTLFLNPHLPIKQVWKLSSSKTDVERVIYGSQDNGTAWYKNGAWEQLSGGDGGSCAIHPENPDIYYGTVCVSKGVVSNTAGFKAPVVEENKTQYIFPMEIDAQNPSTVYYASEQVFRQNSPTSDWEQVGNFTWPANSYYTPIDQVKIAPSNSNILYLVNNIANQSTLARTALVYKSVDKGANWQQISVPAGVDEIKNIAVHPKKENQISIITSQNEVFESANGGGNWSEIVTNISENPLYALAYDGSDENGKYITSIGKVIYSADNLAEPLDLSGNLPLVQINDVDINPVLKKVYIGSYGRGVFKTNLYEDKSLATNTVDKTKDEVLVYPSPFKNTLYIEYKNNNQKVPFELYDVAGKIVKKGEFLNKTEINTQDLPSGMYIVKIKSKNGIISKKMVK